MNDEMLKAAVDRFLAWRLPATFRPDCGISFDGRGKDAHGFDKDWPVGTNLLTADEARAMFEHCLASRAAPPEPDARPPAGVDACSTRDFAVEHGQDFAEYLCAECPNRPKLARRMQEYSMRIMHDMLLKAEADRRTIHRLTQQLASEEGA